MIIDTEKCTGCMKCVPYCGFNAIFREGDKCHIDLDNCVECYVCLKSEICPENAFLEVFLEWPRNLRHTFSSVHAKFTGLGMDGRGTAEMKTNDVTGRFRLGEIGITIDVGRPGVGTKFMDVERIAMALARRGVEFEPQNPTTSLMVDTTTGRFREDVKSERVLSCIIEFKTTEDKLLEIIETLNEVSREIDTVFSVGCISRCRPDGTVPIKEKLDSAGIYYRPNGKVNVGLGRPLAD